MTIWLNPPAFQTASWDFTVSATPLIPYYYWAFQFNYVNQPDPNSGGGYIGLQPNGGTAGGPTSPLVNFALWGASEGASGPNGGTTLFGGEGTGFRVFELYPFAAGVTYHFELEYDGDVVTAHITNTSTGVRELVGWIRAPGDIEGLTAPGIWTEIYAGVGALSDIIEIDATWSNFVFDGVSYPSVGDSNLWNPYYRAPDTSPQGVVAPLGVAENIGIYSNGEFTIRTSGARYDQIFLPDTPSSVWLSAGDYHIIGGVGNDVIRGAAAGVLSGSPTLEGGAGNDSLIGGDGADMLIGGAGSDLIVGFDGIDVVGYASSPTGVIVNLLTGIGSSGDAAGDTISAVENIDGSAFADVLNGNGGTNVLSGADGNDTLDGGDGSDQLLGGDGADTLFGRAGNDTIDGGVGANTLEGGGGDDTYVVRGASDVIVEISGAGVDMVLSSATRTLGAFQENLTLTGASAINGFGNTLANVIAGNDASNTLSGGAGADTVSGASGADVLSGGDGADVLTGGGDGDVLDGGNDADGLWGGEGGDTLYGRTANDTLLGEAANDTLYGGDGDDWAEGGDGDDLIDGLNHNDTLYGGLGADTLYGRQNDDTLYGDVGADALYGGDGIDMLDGGADNDLLDGGNGADDLYGADGADTLYGRQDNDNLSGDGGGDALYGGDGDDALQGSSGNDLLDGGNGLDQLSGGDDADLLYGRVGNDTLNGGGGDDVLDGGGDDDQLFGNDGVDTLHGAQANDALNGGAGDDNINGGDGDDTLQGGSGDDRLDGGSGVDTLIGGTNADTFVFASPLGASNVDTISSFVIADDTIELDISVFTGIGLGVLDANAFVIGPAAADASDRIIYNSSTGALLYDPDGVGGVAAIQFASLAPGLALTSADFVGAGGGP